MNRVKKEILSFFPPVNIDQEYLYNESIIDIQEIKDETFLSYSKKGYNNIDRVWYDPLNNNVQQVDIPNIIFYLGRFRIYINKYQTNNELFEESINKLLNDLRYYLNIQLINLIAEYNYEYNKFIKYAIDISLEHDIDKMSDDLSTINFKNLGQIDVNSLGFNKLNLKKSVSGKIVKKKINKKK